MDSSCILTKLLSTELEITFQVLVNSRARLMCHLDHAVSSIFRYHYPPLINFWHFEGRSSLCITAVCFWSKWYKNRFMSYSTKLSITELAYSSSSWLLEFESVSWRGKSSTCNSSTDYSVLIFKARRMLGTPIRFFGKPSLTFWLMRFISRCIASIYSE